MLWEAGCGWRSRLWRQRDGEFRMFANSASAILLDFGKKLRRQLGFAGDIWSAK